MIGRIRPDWSAPPGVEAFTTTRAGGVSHGPYASLNLGVGTGDDPRSVARNRALLREQLPSEPVWPRQVHGAGVAQRESLASGAAVDGVICQRPGLACCILTADCLPVLFCDRDGTMVGVAHAGWRGLAAGVLEATIGAMDVDPAQLLAWLGPGISGQAYAVGPDLEAAILGRYPIAIGAFQRRNGQLYADLYAVARTVLAAAGVVEVTGGRFCTYTEKERFFSHRRDGPTGRMATAIWLA